MTTLLAIDPGPTQSAFVLYDGAKPTLYGIYPNETLARAMQVGTPFAAVEHCAIERVGHYGTGMSVGSDVFDTCYFTGRLIQIWYERTGGEKYGNFPDMLQRQTIKTRLCGKPTANDSNVRQALIDRFGGDTKAIGGKKCQTCKGKGWCGRDRATCVDCGGTLWQHPPGPLRGISSHCWAALALAVVWSETKRKDVA